MDDFDLKLKIEFLQESTEILESVEEAFLDLEKDPSSKSTMDRIFRLIHTVKGSSYTVGFDALGAFTHTFETLLNILRDGKMEVTPPVADLLLRSNDTLKDFLGALQQDHDSYFDTTAISNELEEMIGEHGPKKWDGPAFGFFDDPGPGVAPVPKASTGDDILSENSLPEASSLSSVQGPRILLVDDEPDFLDYLKEVTEAAGIPGLKIFCARDGVEAFQLFKQKKPHLVLTDLRMPGMDGIELITQIRNMDRNVGVIFLSGFADREHVIDFIRLGATDFQDKPVDSQKLQASINVALKMAQVREVVSRLSSLNFKAYMSAVKIRKIKDEDEAERQVEVQKSKAILDEIAELTNFILKI